MGGTGFAWAVVADEAAIVRELVRRFLESRCDRVDAIADGGALDAKLTAPAVPDLIVADTQLPGFDGLALLERVSRLDGERPAILLLASQPSHDEETRASLGGAIGYLAKPIRLPELDRTLALAGLTTLPSRVACRLRTQPVATARLLECGRAMVDLDVLDLSETGALVTSHAPLAPGTELHLSISVGADWLPVRASVVRIQEPGWSQVAGVGVEFVEPAVGFCAAVRDFVARQG